MKTDIIVIGAGALGLSTALHCALHGRSVVVIERDSAGSQASGRAAGLFKSVQADELRTTLARRAIARAASFGDWAGEPLEVTGSGSILLARTPQHKVFATAEAGQSRGWGVPVAPVSPAELASRVPWYHGDGAELAFWCPEDIYIEEPMSLVSALTAACRRHGVEVAESEEVLAVALARGGAARAAGAAGAATVVTSERSISAGQVIDAAGAWTRQVAELAAAPGVAVAPVRHQLLITEPAAELEPGQPIVRVIDAAVYLRPARGGLMFGGFEPDPLPVDLRAEPASFRTADVPLDSGVLTKMAEQLATEVPLAGQSTVAEHRGGMFTMSPDGKFVAGPVPDAPGLWVASGCNGSGFSAALAIGEALAGWICDAPDRLDISALAPARFGALTQERLVSDGLWQYSHYYDPAASEPA